MKKILAVLVAVFCLSSAHAALAGQAEVRDVAINNNCTPKKTEVYQQAIGSDAETVYRVECTLPKAVGEGSAPSADALLITCNQNLCELLRSVTEEKK